MYAGRHKNPSPSVDKKHQQVFLLWNPSVLVAERVDSFQCIVVPLPEDTSQTSETLFGLELVFHMAAVRSDYVQKCTPLISALNCNIQRDTQEGHTAPILNYFLCVCLSEMMQLPNCLVVSIKIEISAFVNIPFVLGP